MQLKVPITVEFSEDRFREIIDEEIAKCVTEWTPVTESLPESDGGYLVTVESRGIRRTDVSAFEYLDEDNRYYSWAIERCQDVKVVAWMPAPDPYEQEDTK